MDSVNEALHAIGNINVDCTRMFDAKTGEDLRNWYAEAVQELWSLFNAVNSQLIQEGRQ